MRESSEEEDEEEEEEKKENRAGGPVRELIGLGWMREDQDDMK